jgi:hypothetical protein
MSLTLAAAHTSQRVTVITPVLRRAWIQAFDVGLSRPSLSRCARAIANDQPWSDALWPDGWQRPASPPINRRGGRAHDSAGPCPLDQDANPT